LIVRVRSLSTRTSSTTAGPENFSGAISLPCFFRAENAPERQGACRMSSIQKLRVKYPPSRHCHPLASKTFGSPGQATSLSLMRSSSHDARFTGGNPSKAPVDGLDCAERIGHKGHRKGQRGGTYTTRRTIVMIPLSSFATRTGRTPLTCVTEAECRAAAQSQHSQNFLVSTSVMERR